MSPGCHSRRAANIHDKVSNKTRRTNTETRFEPRQRKALPLPQNTWNAPKAVSQFPRDHEIPSRVSPAIRWYRSVGLVAISDV